MIYLPLTVKFGQGNIFSCVCQEFCPQWGKYLGRCLQAGTPLPWAGTLPGQVHPFPLSRYTPRQVSPAATPLAGTPRSYPLAGTPAGRYIPVHSCLHRFHVTCSNMYFICRARMTQAVSAHTLPHSKVPGLSPTNDCTCTSTWIKKPQLPC